MDENHQRQTYNGLGVKTWVPLNDFKLLEDKESD